MKGNILPHKRAWMVAAIILLIAGHGALFYYLSSHLAFSAAMIGGVIVLLALKLIVIKHRGLSGALHTLFHRRPRH
jgi:hypothetical protein